MSKAANYLEFYQKHKIIPTKQRVLDMNSFTRMRMALYSHLGLPPSAFTQSDVLEIGPGTGQNALAIQKWNPRSLTFVDANPKSLSETKKRFKNAKANVSFILSKAEDYHPKKKFDIVLCEGMIPPLPNPEAVFSSVLNCVKPGGVVVTTCMDPISLVPEMLRRWIGRQLIMPGDDLKGQAQKIAEFFKRDIDFLTGMTRLPEDWAMDNIICPWSNRFFTIPDTLKAIQKHGAWLIQGSSPHFLQDWRWHKSFNTLKDFSFQEAHLAYKRFSPNLIDSRLRGDEFSDFQDIRKVCQKVCALVVGGRASSTRLKPLIASLRTLYSGQITERALNEFHDFLAGGALLSAYADLKHFPSLWGRGQQYLSFLRIL